MMRNKIMVSNLIKAAIIALFIFSCMPYSKADEVDTLIQKLKDKDSGIRWKAVEALVKIGAPAVESLIAAMKDEDPNVRWWAEVALEKIKARMFKP